MNNRDTFADRLENAAKARQALLGAPLRPVQCRALRVGIEQDDRLPAHRELAGDVRGERGLAHAAFLVEQGDDHGEALPFGRSLLPCHVECASPFRSVVVQRNGALPPQVREVTLGTLEGTETRAVIVVARVSYA